MLGRIFLPIDLLPAAVRHARCEGFHDLQRDPATLRPRALTIAIPFHRDATSLSGTGSTDRLLGIARLKALIIGIESFSL